MMSCIFFQSGYTPLLTACEYQKAEAVEYLLTLPNIDLSVCAEHVPISDDDVPDGLDGEGKGKSALHIAAIHDSGRIAKMLIEKGCPLCIQDLEVSSSYCVLHILLMIFINLHREIQLFMLLVENQAIM